MFIHVQVKNLSTYNKEPIWITINSDHIIAIYKGYLVMSRAVGYWWQNDSSVISEEGRIPLAGEEWERLCALLKCRFTDEVTAEELVKYRGELKEANK